MKRLIHVGRALFLSSCLFLLGPQASAQTQDSGVWRAAHEFAGLFHCGLLDTSFMESRRRLAGTGLTRRG